MLYADDILLYMPIVNDTDCAALQSDIDKILNWTTANLMSFNSSKCKHMIISRKKSHHVASAFLGGQVLELVDHYKYLGFHLSADLSWSYTTFNVSATKPEKSWAFFTGSSQAMWIALLC